MRVFFCIGAVLFNIATIKAANTDHGLKFRVSHQGLNYAAEEAMNVAETLLLQQEIPSFKGETDLPIGTVNYALEDLRIIEFDKGTADVHLNDDEAIIDIGGIGLLLKGKWAYAYKLGFIPISDRGSFDLKASGGDLKLGVVIGMGDKGKLTLHITHCLGGIDNLDVTFHGGASWLYNIFRKLIANSIKEILNELLCDGIETAIVDYLGPLLDDLVLEFPIADIGSLDFHFTAPSAFNQEAVETYHKGEFFWVDDRTEAPFSPAPMPEPDQELRMITVWMSDYVINSLFYVLHKHNLTNIDISDNNLPESQRGLLNMTCPGSACFGSILPKHVSEQFPDSTVSIKGWTNAQPQLEVNSEGIHGKVEARLDFIAVKPNGETVLLFSTLTKLDASMDGHMENNKLKFNVENISPKVTLLETNVDGISSSLLTLIFRIGINGVLKPLINDLGEKGIPIPDIDMIEYVNPYLMLTDNTIIMMLDVAYAPSYVMEVSRMRPHLFRN